MSLTVDVLNKILYDFDFLAVVEYGAPKDEYLSEAQDIFYRLKQYENAYDVPMPQDNVINLLQTVFSHWFHKSLSFSHAQQLAKSIVDHNMSH
jgi:hypothetical protein